MVPIPDKINSKYPVCKGWWYQLDNFIDTLYKREENSGCGFRVT